VEELDVAVLAVDEVEVVVFVEVLLVEARYTPATATMTMITIIATTATVRAIALAFLVKTRLIIK
jgi:hypothetical protein